jgi:Flp pilus assembly protein CpaB
VAQLFSLGSIERMKIRRLILIASLLVAVAALASWLIVSHWERSDQTFKILPKLAAAKQSYVRDHASRGQPLPASVTLQDLVSGGYVSTDEVRSLAGADVTFYPAVTDATPQAILVRVRMPDGIQIAALADGSVMQLPYQSSK